MQFGVIFTKLGCHSQFKKHCYFLSVGNNSKRFKRFTFYGSLAFKIIYKITSIIFIVLYLENFQEVTIDYS